MGMKQPRFSWIVPGQNWQLDHETAVGNLCFQAEFVDFEFVATKFPQKKVTTVWYIPVSWNKLTRDWFKFTYFILFLVVISKTNFFFFTPNTSGRCPNTWAFFQKKLGLLKSSASPICFMRNIERLRIFSLYHHPASWRLGTRKGFFWGLE